MNVTTDTAAACRQIISDPGATVNEYDAAQLALKAHATGSRVDQHIAYVLVGYAQRQLRVNRYGK